MLQINVKLNSITVLVNRVKQFHFDYSGRLIGHYDDGEHFRIGLDGSVVYKSDIPNAKDRYLESDEIEKLYNQWVEQWKCWPEEQSEVKYFDAEPIDTHLFLNQVTVRGENRVNNNQLFRHIWGKIPILPPEFYQSLVLNITSGCSHNECNFCTFYKLKPYSVRTPQELQNHLKEVEEFFGTGITARRGIFLGEANAMAVPQPRLVSLMQPLQEWIQKTQVQYPTIKLNRIGSFLDGFTGIRKTVDDWRELRNLGLTDVAMGIESGSLNLLGKVGKPMDLDKLKEIVSRLKEADISLELIFLIGLGGKTHRDEHFDHSINLIKELQINSNDRVQLSLLNPDLIDTEYPFATDLLSKPELEEEYQLWKTSLVSEMATVEVRKYPTQLFLV